VFWGLEKYMWKTVKNRLMQKRRGGKPLDGVLRKVGREEATRKKIKRGGERPRPQKNEGGS